jgi:hypothetical protein
MDDHNQQDPNNLAGDWIDDPAKKAARDFDTSAAPWITGFLTGFLLFAVFVLGVVFLGPWDKPTQTTSTPPAPTQSAAQPGTPGNSPSPGR